MCALSKSACLSHDTLLGHLGLLGASMARSVSLFTADHVHTLAHTLYSSPLCLELVTCIIHVGGVLLLPDTHDSPTFITIIGL